jgi:DNA-binding transcriptional MerR regulator
LGLTESNRGQPMGEEILNVAQVAKIANCHRNTVLHYERRGFIRSRRDANNFRRFRREDALRLKQILKIRRPVEG